MTYQILLGNNLDILPTLPDNSVDSIVTDPPYELGFMGKKWDSSGIAYSVELWQQCLRVLKPGGHLLSFGGTRTWHRVAVGIEDAGFEIRDSMAWLYGSGFPKSLDVSKAIDKDNGKSKLDFSEFGNYVKECRESKGWSRKQLDEMMGTNTAVSWWEGRASGVQLPSLETYNRLKPMIGMDNRFDDLIDWAEAEREIIGHKPSSLGGTVAAGERNQEIINLHKNKIVDITAPSTPEAQQWQGWGTALKPAFEPIVVARKPIEGTVANNVLKWGTGGLNIDGSRIGTETITSRGGRSDAVTGDERTGKALGMYGAHPPLNTQHTGRWPANIILDPYTAELLDEQSGTTNSKAANRGLRYSGNHGGLAGQNKEYKEGTDGIRGFTDSGGASRFFYVAKASKKDRNEGLDELPLQVSSNYGSIQERSSNPAKQNFHPTVKPTTLMEYLIKLVTPPGGTVLDPFTGSGSTGKAAILQGFDFIGIEMTQEYLPIIEGRLKHAEQLVAEAKEQDKLKENEVLF